MRREATPEEFTEINAIIETITVSDTNIVDMPNANYRRAQELVTSIHGYRINNPTCPVCVLNMVDILRRIVGLGPARRPATQTMQDERMQVCISCPAYHEGTKSCGRLVLDTFSPRPVEIDGRMVNPCGCHLPLKVKFKSERCPANKWHR